MLVEESSRYLLYQIQTEIPDMEGKNPWSLMQVRVGSLDKPDGIYALEELPPVGGMAIRVEAEFETQYLQYQAREESIAIFHQISQSLDQPADELVHALGQGLIIVYSYANGQ